MIDHLNSLQPEFKQKVLSLLLKLKFQDVIMTPVSGLRTIEEQAKKWREGRPLKTINTKISTLRSNNANFLADAIEGVGPQMAKNIVTHTIPGYSWHNWGYALDCYVVKDGHLIFSDKDPLFKSYGKPGYKTYADEAIKLGMKAGLYFRSVDSPHIQFHIEEVPKLYTLQYVNDYFRDRHV